MLQALPGKDHSAFDADVADTKTLTVLRDEITNRYGRLDISSEGRVRAFLEKDSGASGPGVINAGVYLFSAAMLDTIDEMPGPSLERDVFEKLPAGTLNAVTGEGAFIDIGTPDDLARAADVLKPYAQDS